jgi:hypothetical protein
LRVLGNYASALDVLDQYDHQRLRVASETMATSETETFELTPESARQAINTLRLQFGVASCLPREGPVVRKPGAHNLSKLQWAGFLSERRVKGR